VVCDDVWIEQHTVRLTVRRTQFSAPALWVSTTRQNPWCSETKSWRPAIRPKNTLRSWRFSLQTDSGLCSFMFFYVWTGHVGRPQHWLQQRSRCSHPERRTAWTCYAGTEFSLLWYIIMNNNSDWCCHATRQRVLTDTEWYCLCE